MTILGLLKKGNLKPGDVTAYRKKQLIYTAICPTALHVILEGAVIIRRGEFRTNAPVLHLLGPGHLFGFLTTLPTACCQEETAIALQATRLMSWKSEDIEPQILADPELGMALLCEIIICEQMQINRIQDLNQETVMDKLVKSLVLLARMLGAPDRQGTRVSGITQQELADIVGTTRELVSAKISTLREKNLIISGGKQSGFIVPDLGRLSNSRFPMHTRGFAPRGLKE